MLHVLENLSTVIISEGMILLIHASQLVLYREMNVMKIEHLLLIRLLLSQVLKYRILMHLSLFDLFNLIRVYHLIVTLIRT